MSRPSSRPRFALRRRRGTNPNPAEPKESSMRSAIRTGSGRRNPTRLPEPQPAMHPADRRAIVLLAITAAAVIYAAAYALGSKLIGHVLLWTVGGLVVGAVVFGVVALAVALVAEWWEQR